MKTDFFPPRNRLGTARHLVIVILAAFALSGCSTVRIDAAGHLGDAGHQTADALAETLFLSDAFLDQAGDIDTFVFYYEAGGEAPPELEAKRKELFDSYRAVHDEFKSRRQVFSDLGLAYQQFAGLADKGAELETAAAVDRLSGAVNKYAESQGKKAIFSGSAQKTLFQLGWLAAAELKKKQIRKASSLIRERLTAFHALLKDTLVKEQMLGFQEHLSGLEGNRLQVLWDAGLFDPSPLLDQLGAGAGLQAAANADETLRKDKILSASLGKVIESRLRRNTEALTENYHASLRTLEELIREHEALEKDGPLNLTRLIRIAEEQRRSSKLLTAGKEALK
jgi:hypothetical protein